MCFGYFAQFNRTYQREFSMRYLSLLLIVFSLVPVGCGRTPTPDKVKKDEFAEAIVKIKEEAEKTATFYREENEKKVTFYKESYERKLKFLQGELTTSVSKEQMTREIEVAEVAARKKWETSLKTELESLKTARLALEKDKEVFLGDKEAFQPSKDALAKEREIFEKAKTRIVIAEKLADKLIELDEFDKEGNLKVLALPRGIVRTNLEGRLTIERKVLTDQVRALREQVRPRK